MCSDLPRPQLQPCLQQEALRGVRGPGGVHSKDRRGLHHSDAAIATCSRIAPCRHPGGSEDSLWWDKDTVGPVLVR